MISWRIIVSEWRARISMIDYLADQPEFLKEIARLFWREWQEFIKEKIKTSPIR
jgi:hypothetical protein